MAKSTTLPPKHHATLSVAYISKWCRVLSNISAGLLIIGTGIIVAFLLYEGMFYSTIMYPEHQDTWAPYYESCLLESTGFLDGSCEEEELQATGAVPWNAIGKQLAIDLEITSQVFVTTCVVGASNDDYSATFMLLIDDSAFPTCNPVGPQPVIGMAAIETLSSVSYPTDAFLLSTYSDHKPLVPIDIVETTGNIIHGTTSMMKSIIARNGSTVATTWDQRNYETTLNCLNRLFLMRIWLVGHFIDISDQVDALTGYSVGKLSGFIFTCGWDNSHHVDNYQLLLVFQTLVCFLSLGLLSNDGVITLEGLSGLLRNKPVLTYDIIAAFERRKLLLFSLICTFCFSPLYADAIRYTYDIHGHHYWSLCLLMISVMLALSWVAILTALQWLPAPSKWYNRPLCYSTPIFVYITILAVLVSQAVQNRGRVEADNLWDSTPSELMIVLYSTEWTGGAYTLDGTTPIIYILIPEMVVIVIGAWICSILAHKLLYGYIILDTSWTSQNDFLSQIDMPRWVTGLDLDHKNAIAIGTKLYCKPSTMVLLGYCTVRNRSKYGMTSGETHGSQESSAHETTKAESYMNQSKSKSHQTPSNQRGKKNEYFVLPIYFLLPSIIPWLRQISQPHVYGVILSNKFEKKKSTTILEKGQKFQYSRGDCCG